MITFLTQNIFVQYLVWHFFDVPSKILKALKNLLLFNLEYFSLGLLLRTFFSHWHRYSFAYPRSFDAGKYLEAFLSNLISRLLGAIMRTFLIGLGLVIEALIFFVGALILLGWLLLPFILIMGFYLGFKIG